MTYLKLENTCRRILIGISKIPSAEEIFEIYQHVVLNDPFYRRNSPVYKKEKHSYDSYFHKKKSFSFFSAEGIFLM